MNYNLYNLNSGDFEHLIQSLMQKLLGATSIVFGAGKDGARELTYNGKAPFPSDVVSWSGYWVIQAKFKNKDDGTNDFAWVEKNFKKDIDKFGKKGYKYPDNYIFLTNTILTPVAISGGRDKIEELKKKYTSKIPNIFIGGYDEINKFLDNNRDVATAYSSFILPGDILASIYEYYKYESNKAVKDLNLIYLFLQKEFNNESKSKLIQAGDLVRTINLENVFVDLLVEKKSANYRERNVKIVEYLINKGEASQRNNNNNKFVIIGGAGAGKSTITQFVCQFYTAHFLKHAYKKKINAIEAFLSELQSTSTISSSCLRLPIKIVLKDYAGWLNERIDKGNVVTVLQYIRHRINYIADGQLDTQSLRDILKKISFIFVFDGLDEVPASSNREQVLKEINDFIEIELENAQCDYIVITTTRPQGYTKEFNEDAYEHTTLIEMTDEICLEYLKKLLKNIESSPDAIKSYLKTLSDALKNDITGRLMRTPLQATIMTILVTSGGEPSVNKYQLFKKYYETIFNREKQKKVSKLINTSETQINQIHDLLGYQLQTESEITSNPYSNLDVNQFEKLINEYLRKEAWKESEIQIFIEEFKNTITHRLVFITETQDKKVGFVIRSLQEFFAANYYMNVNENEIRSRILKIATSAYWRNTLIFSIGNLRINKEYLVDDVFTICEELNGLGNSSKDISVASSIKSGSWLALDILTEGIISDAKKFLNKFITLLDPLIDTPLITDHRKFSKLNDTLKSDWIIDEFLIKRLYDNNIKSPFTFYEISCIMIKTSNIGNTVKLKTKLYETVSNKNRIIFFNALYMIREIDELFINLFLDILLNYPPLTLEYIFRSELESNSFIDSTIDKAIMNKNADQIKRFLEEIILIALKLNSSTNNSIKRIISFLEKIVQKKLANINFTPPNYSFIHDTYKINYYVLYGCLNVEIISVYDKNLTNINIFKNICEVYNLKYLFLYFTYLTFPTLENLMNFLTELDTQNSNVKNRFISTTNDWLLNFILKSCDNRLTKISITNILAALNILNQDDISIKEAEITNSNREDIKLKFATSTSYNVSESVAGIKKLISIIKSNEKNYIDADVINSLVTLFNISNTFKNSRSKPSEVDFIIECISTMQVDYSFIKQTDLISLWFFIISEGNKQKIYKLLVNSKFFDKLDFDKFSYFYHITLLSEIVESFYKQAVDLLNVFINLENDNEFIVFLTYVTMNSEVAEFEAPKIYLSKLNFNSLINNKYTSSIDKISQFILSLFSNTNPWPNNQFVIDIYINLRNENPKLFSYLIRVVNNYVLDKLWITTLVLSITNLNSFNSENDNNAKSDYLSYLKNVSESRKSDI